MGRRVQANGSNQSIDVTRARRSICQIGLIADLEGSAAIA